MGILDKVKTRSNICSVEIAFSGTSIPSAIEGWQPFYNSTFEDTDFEKIYSTLSTLDFAEESVESAAGDSYKQKIVFRFPATDQYRAERLVLLKKTKFVKLNLTSGLSIVVGRNDFFQNTAPKITIKTDHHLCEVSIESSSITPSGYVPSASFGLPSLIPVEL
ncbi:hypothetical protein ACI6PS_02455 [Flavobacterium sp. PLA-1-15]|uniref:hypothetical protein n=1 Tax=Flavobacterium sp. PLA-1-15 TaxID=3380533 RepID=UPI003B7A6E9A